MEDRIKQIMGDTLGVDPEQVEDTAAMDNTDGWDSFAHINLCLALEQEFQIVLDVDEMESMISFFDIVDVVQSKI